MRAVGHLPPFAVAAARTLHRLLHSETGQSGLNAADGSFAPQSGPLVGGNARR